MPQLKAQLKLPLFAQVLNGNSCSKSTRRTHHTTTGMSSTTAEQEPINWCLRHRLAAVGDDGSCEEELIQGHGAVEDVSTGQAERALKNGRRKDLLSDDTRLEA